VALSTPQAKQAAQAEQLRWQAAENDMTLAGTVTSALAAGGAGVLGVTAAAVTPPIVVTAAAVWFFRRKAQANQRIINDPPRGDYRTSTRPYPPTLYRQGFGTDEFSASAFEFLYLLAQAIGYAEAMVLADERRQGALNDGDRIYARARRRDMTDSGRNLVAVSRRLPRAADTFGSQLLEHELREPVADAVHEVELPADWAEVLTNDAQAALFRAGFRVEMVTGPIGDLVRVDDPYQAAATSLVEAAQGASETRIRLEADLAPLTGDEDV
jgi:hypothetical protein